MEIYNVKNITGVPNFQILIGQVVPNGNYDAEFGSLYIRPYGTAVSPCIYVKLTELGDNTGWVYLQNIPYINTLPDNLDDYYSRSKIFYYDGVGFIYWDGSSFRRLIDNSLFDDNNSGTTAERPSSPENLMKYYDTTLHKTITYASSNSRWFDEQGRDPDLTYYGTTEDRPTERVPEGFCYFDVTLGKPVWRYSSNWVDATGAAA